MSETMLYAETECDSCGVLHAGHVRRLRMEGERSVWCEGSGGSRRLIEVGSLLIEKKGGEWRDEDAQLIVDFLGLPDTAESLDRVAMGLFDALIEHESCGLSWWASILRVLYWFERALKASAAFLR